MPGLGRQRRDAVVARWGRVCWLCGDVVLYDTQLTIDHVVPLAEGGRSGLDNLRPAHFSCNQLRANPKWDGAPDNVNRQWRNERQREARRRRRVRRQERLKTVRRAR